MNLDEFSLTAPRKNLRGPKVLALIGVAAFGLGIILTPQRAWLNFLLVNYYLIGIGLAGMLFVAIQYATGAGWSVALRRVPEAMAAILPFAALALAAFFLLRPSIYPWVGELGGHTDPYHAFKQWWLNFPFFLVRALAYFVLWLVLARVLVRRSYRQDQDGNPIHTRRNVRFSIIFIAVFAVTFWLASYDWIMSLEPQWYSTIFGVYNFAGLFQSGLAVIILLVIWLQKQGPFKNVITEEHLHDLAKLLFAFSTFWMYIWFSQYMLIWYANNPEETFYFVKRLHGFYQPLFILDMVLNWVVPFIVLLPRWTKRNASILAKVCFVVLLGRWLDLYIMIIPSHSDYPLIGWPEVGLLLGAAGLFLLVYQRALSRASLLPLKDPLLTESLHHHQ